MAKKARARKEGGGDKREQRQGQEQAEDEEDLIAPLVERLARELLALPDEAWGDEDAAAAG